MTPRKRKVNRSVTDRLKRLIEAELNQQDLTDEEAAREGKLPGNAFHALRKGHRPSIDRADEPYRVLGISMTIGAEGPTAHGKPENATSDS